MINTDEVGVYGLSAPMRSVEYRHYKRDPEWRHVTDPLEDLISDLLAVRKGGKIRIWSGEGNPAVYNDPRFRTAAEAAKSLREAEIVVITGPLLVVDNEGRNGLLELGREGIITLYHRLARGATAHFRVTEGDEGYRYYTEYPHPPRFPLEKRLAADFGVVAPVDEEREAEKARFLFDSWVKRIEQRQSSAGSKLPLLTDESGLALLIQTAERYDFVFDYLGPDELFALPGADSVLRHGAQFH